MAIFRLLLAALLVFSLAGAASLSAEDPVVISVHADGSGDYETIQAAIDAAPSGAVVKIGPGVWKEALTVTHPLTLEGSGWETCRLVSTASAEESINPEATQVLGRLLQELDAETRAKLREALQRVYGSSPVLTVKETAGVVVRKIALLRSEPVRKGSFQNTAAVDILDAGIRMEGCAILESPGNGLGIRGDSRVQIEHCLVANAWGTGVKANVSENGSLEVRECEIRNNAYSGMLLGGASPSLSVTRCRIHSTGWHGIRYGGAPTIEGNVFYRTGVSGIYASGQTDAMVRNNLFFHSGISCWFQNGDTIESNTFIGDLEAEEKEGISQGIQVLGASRPTIHHNLFVTCEQAVSLGDIKSDSPHAKSPGQVTLIENAFWGNQRSLTRSDAATDEPVELSLPEGNLQLEQPPQFSDVANRDFTLQEQSPLAKAGIGAEEILSWDSPWPLQPEERRAMAAVAERLQQTAQAR
jgi:hypothetical protein